MGKYLTGEYTSTAIRHRELPDKQAHPQRGRSEMVVFNCEERKFHAEAMYLDRALGTGQFLSLTSATLRIDARILQISPLIGNDFNVLGQLGISAGQPYNHLRLTY